MKYLKEYWMHIVVVILTLLAYLQIAVKTKKKGYSQSDLQDYYNSYQVPVEDRQVITLASLTMADGFGFTYDWWNVNRWYERDLDVYNALKELTEYQLGHVFNVYEIMTGRKGQQDFFKYLDKKYRVKLSNIIVG